MTRTPETAIIMRRQGNALVATDERSQDAVSKLRGDDVYVWIHRARNAKQVRKLNKLYDILFDNQEAFPNRATMVDAIKIAAGAVKTMKTPKGKVSYEPMSITEMGQTEFAAFYERVLDVVTKSIIPGISRADIRRELEAFTDDSRQNPHAR